MPTKAIPATRARRAEWVRSGESFLREVSRLKRIPSIAMR